MANEALRTSQLGIVTTLANTDRVVVLTNPATSAQTQTITVTNLALSAANQIPYANSSVAGTVKVGAGLSMSINGVLSAPLPLATNTSVGVVQPDSSNNISIGANGTISLHITGPYANDSNAASHSIAIGQLYYNSNGTVQIRLS